MSSSEVNSAAANSAPKYDLETIRHSSAHLMAQAITELFPDQNVQLGIGPTTDNGFYYDISCDHTFTDADLKSIEKRMKEIIKRKLPVERHEIAREDAIKFFEERGQLLKNELIRDFPAGETISYYSQGEFVDLCRGPHVENTGHLPTSFKLLNTAGAYWRGDESRPMLQRIYGASFFSRDELKAHLKFLEEAKKRDHRKLGKELGFFHFDPVAPASPFFLPKGAFLYNRLVDFVRELYTHYGYKEVITPQVLDVELWHTSGHYENYKENMFFTNVDKREFALKPMNCPCHMLMFGSTKHSYRDLPLRYADFGRLHRYEKSGTVSGLTRVRTFCQDDAHVFLSPDSIQDEVLQLMDMFFVCYEHFKFDKIKVNLSTRPEKKIGDDATWDKAEESLKQALEKSGHPFEIKEGDGAFYGPKIDIEISDAIGRYHQLGTIQLDFLLPERFDLKFNDSDGTEKRPVVIHRALLGSLERFLGVYIEHTAGIFPFWLAPQQVRIIPVNNELHLDYAEKLAHQLKSHNIRVEVDSRNETLGLKTRQTQKGKIPFMAVIGDKEIESNSVTVRAYGQQEQVSKTIEDFAKELIELESQFLPEKIKQLRQSQS